MKKIILSAILVMGLAISANAQNVLPKGGMVANIGVGIPLLEENETYTLPLISASWEYGVVEFGRPGSIGIGAYVGFWGNESSAAIGGIQSASAKYFNTLIGARAAYHYSILPRWEIYAGGVAGVEVDSYKGETSGIINSSSSDSEAAFGFQVFAGTRVLFTSSFGAFLEAGYGVSNVSLGFTFRF